ncbi:MAG: TfoX/Sxy family protein [Anaerolineales bacterium]|nr:TfoX/Sxy family protein [Anaerolineales bacterium]
MAYDEGLLERMRPLVENRPEIEEKRMFGGMGFFVNGHFACGSGPMLILRVGPERYLEALAHPHADVCAPSGRPMKGWVTVEPDGYAEDNDLAQWVDLALTFASTLPPK